MSANDYSSPYTGRLTMTQRNAEVPDHYPSHRGMTCQSQRRCSGEKETNRLTKNSETFLFCINGRCQEIEIKSAAISNKVTSSITVFDVMPSRKLIRRSTCSARSVNRGLYQREKFPKKTRLKSTMLHDNGR